LFPYIRRYASEKKLDVVLMLVRIIRTVCDLT
jgi:hypothetical protein